MTVKESCQKLREMIAENPNRVVFGLMDRRLGKFSLITVSHLDVTDEHTSELDRIMAYEQWLHIGVSALLDMAPTGNAVVFTEMVADAERMSEIMNRHEPKSSQAISGQSSVRGRKEALDNFAFGTTRFLFNVASFPENDDLPDKVVVMSGRENK